MKKKFKNIVKQCLQNPYKKNFKEIQDISRVGRRYTHLLSKANHNYN